MISVAAMSDKEAREFADRWLPAWTGNDPELLLSFYTDDAQYSDPGVRDGITGRDELLAYFEKLLGDNPAWVWTHTGSTPMQDGFLNHWHASIPVGADAVEVDGVCVVQLRAGRICQNHVYFDRTKLVSAIRTHGAQR